MPDNQCRMHHVEVSAFADDFLEAIAEIAKGPGDALARNREHRPDPGKRNQNVDMLGSNSSENSPFPASPKGRIEVQQWRLTSTTLHAKRRPRNYVVRIEPTFDHKSARHVPVQWQDMT